MQLVRYARQPSAGCPERHPRSLTPRTRTAVAALPLLTDDGHQAPNGVLFYRLEVEGRTLTQKMAHLR
jgi:hypothetical protein